MKKIFLLLIVSTFLVSCGNDEKEQNKEQEIGAIEEAGVIINDYADTLEGSIQDAKAVRDLYNQNNVKLEEGIKNAYK